jgi:Protein of unknown function (DUF2975)
MKNFQNKAKIIKVGAALRTLTFALFVFCLLGMAGVYANALLAPLLLHQPFRFSMFLPIPETVFALLAFYKLFRFFDRLRLGNFFDAQTVGNLNSAGTWWLAMWFLGIIRWFIMQSLSFEKFDWSQFHSDRWGWLFAGLALKFVAWLLQEAQELQEEQELTV